MIKDPFVKLPQIRQILDAADTDIQILIILHTPASSFTDKGSNRNNKGLTHTMRCVRFGAEALAYSIAAAAAGLLPIMDARRGTPQQ